MAFDAGAIEARLTIATAEASADLDKIEARVRALEGSPHVIRINAVFDSADIGKARRAFAMLDQAVSYDAMQRLRSSPQGSVLGALNALFSPHPVIGGPSPQQAAAKGLLGQMFSSQGGGTTVVPGSQGNTNVLRNVATGQGGSQAAATGDSLDAAVAAMRDAASGVKQAAAAVKAAAADQAGAAADLRGAASELRNAAISTAGAQSVFASLQKMFGGGTTAAAGAAGGGGGQGGGGGGAGAAAGAAAGGAASGGGGGGGGAAAGAAAAAGLAGAATAAGNATAAATPKIGRFSDAIAAGAPIWTAGAGRAGFLGGKIQLFGGALTGILPAFLATQSGLELIIHSALDLTATLIPATVAFGAFAAVSVPTVKDLYQILQSTYTVNQAFGQSIYPLSGQFQKLADAVKPEVYVLFGEALSIANNNAKVTTTSLESVNGKLVTVKQTMTPFQYLVTSAGRALDQLGARFVNAVTNGAGFSKFIAGAGDALAGWGNLIGNIGGILSGILKTMPGYASALLNVLNGVTHVIEGIVNSGLGQWFLRVGLAAHGALVYIGLLGTGFALLTSRGLAVAAPLLLNAAVAIERFGPAGKAASGGLLSLASGAEQAAGLPWGWIGIAAAGVGFLVYQLVNAKSAAQQFADGVQQNLLNGTLPNLGATLQTTLTDSISSAHQAYYNYLSLIGQTGYFDTSINKTRQQAAAVQDAAQKYADYNAVIQTAQQDIGVYNANLKTAANVFGSSQAALAAFTAAGISSNDFMTTSKSKFQQLIIEAQGYNNAIQAVTQTTGRYGAAQNALNFTAGDSANALGQVVSAMSKVTQAEDSLLNTILGGEQAFIGFQQSIQGTSAKFVSPSGLADAAKLAGGNIGGLGQQSLAFANTLYNVSIPALQKTIDALQMQNASTGDLTKVVATGAGEMLQYVGNNTEARSVIADLINNALGPGTVSLKNLNTWVKNNSTSLQGMNTIVANATIQAGDFAGVLQAQVIPMMTQASIAALGGQKWMTAFATGVLNGNSAATLWTQDGAAKIVRMFEVMTGGSIPRAKAAFESWATNTLGITTVAAKNLADQLFAGTNPAVAAAGEAARTAAQKIDQSLIKSLQQIGFDTPAVNTGIHDFSAAILSSGDNSDRTKSARQKLIADLEAAGLNAQTAQGLVNNLQGQIDALHGKTVGVGVSVSGSGGIGTSIKGLPSGITNPYAKFFTLAAGGRIPGYGGGDTIPALLEPGETVVSKTTSKQLADVFKAAGVPGYAAGGVIGGVTGAENWADTGAGVFSAAAARAFVAAVKQQFSKAAASPGPSAYVPGAPAYGGSILAEQQFAASQFGRFGWSVPYEMPALISLWNAESGWSPYAVNPTSGAYGIPQALPAAWGHPYALGDWRNQILWGLNYISNRWHDPLAAEANELAAHWYGNGGLITEPVIGVGMSGKMYGFGEKGPEWVTPMGAKVPGSGASGMQTARLADTINLMLPEGTTLAAAFSELTWQLQAARMRQGMP